MNLSKNSNKSNKPGVYKEAAYMAKKLINQRKQNR